MIPNHNNIDCVLPSALLLNMRKLLYVCEDNGAVINMISKRKSPTMRLFSRMHRVDLDWLDDWISLDPAIKIKHVNTAQKTFSDFFKGHSREELHRIVARVELVGTCHICTKPPDCRILREAIFSSMSKRAQNQSPSELR